MHREFTVGDHVYLIVRERKSSLKLGICAMLSPRYCGPFEVLERGLSRNVYSALHRMGTTNNKVKLKEQFNHCNNLKDKSEDVSIGIQIPHFLPISQYMKIAELG